MTITYSSLGDQRVSEILVKEQQLLLADRASLWGHPSIIPLGTVNNTGSTTLKVPLVGLMGYDKMAAVSEDTAVTETSLTDASVTVTVARQSIYRKITTLARGTDPNSPDLYPRIAEDFLMAAAMRFMEMAAALAAGFSTIVGTSGANMTVDDFFSAIFALEVASVPGPYICVLAPIQITDFQSSLRGEGGAIQYRSDVQDLLNIKGQGMIGSFAGVDIMKSSYIGTANSGADRSGGMWGYGAVGYAEMLPAIADDGVKQEQRGKVFIRYNRDNLKDTEELVGDYYVGTVELQDSMGVTINTDA